MAKKSGGVKGPSQKLSTGSGGGASGVDLKSKMEGAAGLPYRGYKTTGVSHGAHGLLAGKGQKKNAKVPQ